VIAGLVTLVVSVLGAGLTAHLDYLAIIRETGSGGTRPLSLAGMARFVGVDPAIAGLLPTLALVAGFVAIWALRHRPDWGFVVAVVTLVLGSPTVNINWFALLFATLAPAAWPWVAETTERTETADAPDAVASKSSTVPDQKGQAAGL
jgi:hypothetical protein